ncbi:MAG: type II toxin-antitoxin system HipA family toxin [Deltaproteobacteria bacterium]|nr:type II toxin-antitoxin system HipA family toxin [Deltaproteobacteria bacterium]
MTTSEPASCFIFIQLPSGEEVVCGRFAQEALSTGGWRGQFVYARSYRERRDAVPIDPFGLPLEERTFETTDDDGVFGAIRDAAPDAWGRRVIEARLGSNALQSEIDYLLNSPEDRAGALSFSRKNEPPPAVQRFNRVLDLAALQAAAEQIEAGGPFPRESTPQRQLAQLLEVGTSMGGARPKNVVQDADGLWLAKFPMKGDRWNVPVVEAAMLDLARLCGVRSAEHRLEKVGGQAVLLVKRFDRAQHKDGSMRRARMVSAKTVLRANDSVTQRDRWSYLVLADELQRWASDPAEDRRELFRRMVFNALISNLDDHPRNHALIAPRADWRLAPAYDLVPSPVASADRRDLALVIGLGGRWANRGNLLSECERFGFGVEEAGAVIDRMKKVVGARWKGLIEAHGGTSADVRATASAFDYPGFDFELPPNGGDR